MSPTAQALALFVLGVVFHGLWALTIPTPVDLDAQYYLLVAQHLAAGQGAVTDSLWNLSYRPDALPLPADLHWMPAPSRVIVPEVALWPAGGGRLTNVLLAAVWAPVAWALARDLEVGDGLALTAGVLAATGGVYVRYLSTPDSYALYGALGALGLLAVARSSGAGAALVALLAAWTRNDGLFLGLALGLGLGGARGLGVAAAGVLGTASWMVRNHLVGGAAFWRARQVSTDTAEYLSLFDGIRDAPLGVSGRLLELGSATPALLEYWVTPGLLVLTPATVWGAWRHRDRGWVRSLVAFVAVAPGLTVFLAPAVAQHGTLYRSGTAMMAGHLALAAVGLGAAGAWGHRVRGYPRAFLPALAAGAFVVIVLGQGVQRVAEPRPAPPCEAVQALPDGAVVLTSEPLALELHCGVPGVMVTRRLDAAQVRRLSRDYGARHLLVAPAGRQDEASVGVEQVQAWWPGAVQVSERVWRAPAAQHGGP